MFRSPNRKTQNKNCLLKFASGLCRSPEIYPFKPPSISNIPKIKIGQMKKKKLIEKNSSKTICQISRRNIQRIKEVGPLQQYYNNLVKTKGKKANLISRSPELKPAQNLNHKYQRSISPPAILYNLSPKAINLFPISKQRFQNTVANNQNVRKSLYIGQNYEIQPALLSNFQKKQSKNQLHSTKFNSQYDEESNIKKTRETSDQEQSQNKSLGDNLLKIHNLIPPKLVVSIAGSSFNGSAVLEESIVIEQNQRGSNNQYISRLL